MTDYNEMTQTDFDRILISILQKTKASEMISVPGFYDLASEEFNNEVLKQWDNEKDYR